MPPPKSLSKADEQMKQDKLRSSPQPRFLHTRSTPSSRDPPKNLSRKPPPDLLPKKPPKDPAPIAPTPPKAWLSQSSINKAADSIKPPPQQEKKGFWNWRPFRSASLPPPPVDTPQRFHVLYSLHVHSIQNLPASLNGLRLIVHWNRKEEGLQTMPSRVLRGVAEFDETLRQRCTVDGSRNSHQLMLYEPKLFTISVVALDMDELELGKHHIDLSRLLPEEDDAGQGSHSWSTNFELSGMAKGSSLVVTFNYDLLHQETSEESDDTQKTTTGSKLSTASRPSPSTVKAGSDVLAGSKVYKVETPSEHMLKKDAASMVTKERIKTLTEEWSDSQEAWDSQPEKEELHEEAMFINDLSPDLDDEVDLVAGEFLDMLDFGLSNSEDEPDSPRAKLLKQFEHESLFGGDANFRPENADAREQSKLLGTAEERYPGGFRSTTSTEELARNYESEGGLQFASIMEAAELELQKAAQSARSKSRAKELEDEETQALMQRWGLSETSFHDSLSKSTSGFGNTVFGPHLNHPPPLGKGLGSVLYLEDGGSVRSMSPSHFSKSRASGSLVMQASKPVVVPSTIGSSAVDILRHLASLGTETLAQQAMAAMPLEDITGKLADEVIAMGRPSTHASGQKEGFSSQRGNWHPNASSSGAESGRESLADRGKKGGYDDYVSLEDLAPLAMQNIEALAIDGLKVQADVTEEDAPSYLDAAAWGILGDAKKGNKDNFHLSHDVAGMRFDKLRLGESSPSDANEGGPLSMALTIEEWSKLDAGILDDDTKSKERSLALLAAHNADCRDWQLASKEGKGHSRRRGNMGNTLMIAMLVQLRDPLQNFEPVGAPMMTLIQAERVMLPPKPRIGRSVTVTGNSEVDDELIETIAQKEEPPQFKLTGVHMSGLKSLDDEATSGRGPEIPKKGWGSQKQLQSGSRWLAAQGMAKGSSKPSLLKGKAAPPPPAQTKVKPGETLWSISARVNGSGHKWRDLAKLNPHIRNPDVILPNDTLRTR
eukprot:c12464_g1_i1 orf=170-3163(+)